MWFCRVRRINPTMFQSSAANTFLARNGCRRCVDPERHPWTPARDDYIMDFLPFPSSVQPNPWTPPSSHFLSGTVRC